MLKIILNKSYQHDIMTRYNLEQLENIAQEVRRDIIEMVYQAQSGHPGGSLGCVEYFVALYFHVMQYKSKFNMHGIQEDLFFLSNGHISPVWYSVLAHAAFFDREELHSFRKLNTRLQGHPSVKRKLPGIRIASGSLGQGLSVALGAALTKKLNKDPSYIYVLMGDGEQQEGQIWEAAMFAAHHKVDNIIATIDYNKQQIDGPVEDTLSLQDLAAKWQAFGWEIIVSEGNNMKSLIISLEKALSLTKKKKPILNIMNTTMGKGIDFMEDKYQWHGIAPNAEEYEKAIAQITASKL